MSTTHLHAASVIGNCAGSLEDGRIVSACSNGIAVAYVPTVGTLSGVRLVQCNGDIAALTCSGSMVAIAVGRKVRVFDFENGNDREMDSLKLDFLVKDVAVGIINDQPWVVAAGVSGACASCLSSPRTVRLAQSYSICNVCFSASGKLLLLGAVDGHLGVWSTSKILHENQFTASWIDVVKSLHGRFVDAAFGPLEESLIVGTWKPNSVLLYARNGDMFMRVDPYHWRWDQTMSHPVVLCFCGNVVAFSAGETVILYCLQSKAALSVVKMPDVVVGLCMTNQSIFVQCMNGFFKTINPCEFSKMDLPMGLRLHGLDASLISSGSFNGYVIPDSVIHLESHDKWYSMYCNVHKACFLNFQHQLYLVVSSDLESNNHRIKFVPVAYRDEKICVASSNAVSVNMSFESLPSQIYKLSSQNEGSLIVNYGHVYMFDFSTLTSDVDFLIENRRITLLNFSRRRIYEIQI